MDRSILAWLLEEENPEVRLRTLKECEKLAEDDARVIDCKSMLLQSKIYGRGLKKLRTDKPWAKYDAILGFAEWGLTRSDIGEDIDGEVFALIESTGFKMLCGEPLLLRNLVKLGYGHEDVVKKEIDSVLGLIQQDGGFRCISTNKKINDPRKPHKSCARLTVEYLLLVAELHMQGYSAACEAALKHYFTKRNIFYRTDDMQTPMVDVMLGLFSGFPTHHFTDDIAQALRENLPRRESLVFISAWPADCARNDDDSDGMHGMFAERGMAFADHCVIDRRTGAADAARLVRQADCVFLMGGDVTLQMALIRDLGLVTELHASHAVILGVSAGAMNMGRYVADVWETKALCEGIGLTDITAKGHYVEGAWFIPVLKEMSMTRPIVAMEDESAIFILSDAVWSFGKNHWIDKGEIRDGYWPNAVDMSIRR